MSNAGSVSLSLANLLERSLDASAHNLANANTAGFRAMHPLFEAYESESASIDQPTISFVQSAGSYFDFSQGAMVETGNPLDVAISGDGWFGFRMDNGSTAYGRHGQLVIDRDSQLTTVSGQPILDASNSPIQLPEEIGAEVTIAKDGTISDSSGAVVGNIGVFHAPRSSQFNSIGAGLYMVSEGELAAPEESQADILQGYVESSNVQPILEMTRLIEIHRTYERSANLMTESHELTKTAVQKLGRFA